MFNSIARKVIEQAGGNHPERVFTYDREPITKIYNSAWKKPEFGQAKASTCPRSKAYVLSAFTTLQACRL